MQIQPLKSLSSWEFKKNTHCCIRTIFFFFLSHVKCAHITATVWTHNNADVYRDWTMSFVITSNFHLVGKIINCDATWKRKGILYADYGLEKHKKTSKYRAADSAVNAYCSRTDRIWLYIYLPIVHVHYNSNQGILVWEDFKIQLFFFNNHG